VLLAVANAVFGSNTCLGISSLIQMFLFIAAAGAVLRAVLTETKVGFRTILGAVSVYIIFGLLFTFLYVGIDRLQSGPFFGAGAHLGTGDYVFFSITTLTTTGYGNLVPAGQPGQMFAGLEMLIGQIFLVTLIAGLVSLWRPGQLARIRRSQ
jgi:Ion channel